MLKHGSSVSEARLYFKSHGFGFFPAYAQFFFITDANMLFCHSVNIYKPWVNVFYLCKLQAFVIR